MRSRRRGVSFGAWTICDRTQSALPFGTLLRLFREEYVFALRFARFLIMLLTFCAHPREFARSRIRCVRKPVARRRATRQNASLSP